MAGEAEVDAVKAVVDLVDVGPREEAAAGDVVVLAKPLVGEDVEDGKNSPVRSSMGAVFLLMGTLKCECMDHHTDLVF